MGCYEEGKCKWTGSQKAYTDARAEANGVHLLFNPLPGLIHQDSHQAMIFDALHGMDKGVLPFTMRASMTMCVAFEESIGHQGLTERRIGQRMSNMAGPLPGHVPGQIWHEKFSLMFPLNKHCQRTLVYIHKHKGETHCTVRGCDMQLILLVLPFVLHNFFKEEVEDWNRKHPADSDKKIDPTTLIIPVVTELLDFYQLLRMKGKDIVEIPQMDLLGRNFLDLSRETFKDFTVGKDGQKKHICSSEKMHRIVHCAAQAAALGDLINTEAMSEIVHRLAVRGPQHLVSRSDATGPGLLKIAERKEGSRMLMEGHSGSCMLLFMTHLCFDLIVVATAAVEEDPSQHWIASGAAGGGVLLPSRWVDSDQMKSTMGDNDPTGGRCLGIRCLMWDRCQVPSDLTHAVFGGRTHPSGSGWAALSKASLLLGAPNFLGGMPVLKHLPVKIAEFLHHVHGEKFSSLGLPHPGGGGQSRPTLLQLDKLFERIECVGNDETRLVLHGGVMIGHKEFEGHQRVYAWPWPHKRFRDYNRQDPVILLPEGADRETFRPDPDNVWYGQCLLVFSFVVRGDGGARYRMKCVLISTLEEYDCPEDDAAAGDWIRKAETRRLYELDPSLPRLYVMPISSILGTLPLVRAGDTGTIPYHMRGRSNSFPGGKADTAPGKGDGSRLYFVNSWAMRWSRNP